MDTHWHAHQRRFTDTSYWLLPRHNAQEGWQGNGTSTLLQCCQEAVLSSSRSPALAQTPSRSPRTQQLQHGPVPPRRNLAVARRRCGVSRRSGHVPRAEVVQGARFWDGMERVADSSALRFITSIWEQHSHSPSPGTSQVVLCGVLLHTVCGSWDDSWLSGNGKLLHFLD